jgi:uncharacterized protein (TIGR02099 family)
MPTPLRRRIRQTRRYASYALALTLVLLALLVGMAAQLLPMVERHPQRVAAWLSERTGKTIQFDQLQTRWTRRGPLLQLQGLRIGADDGIRIGEAEVVLAMYSGLLPRRSLIELRLRGLALTLLRADDGVWSVQGLPSGGGGDPLDSLRRLGELQVIGGKLRVLAPSLGIDTSLPRIDMRLQLNAARLQVGARSWIDPQRAPVTTVLDFDRQRGDGQAWLQAELLDLQAWAPLLQAAGVRAVSGSGHLQSWVQLRGHRIASVIVDTDLQQLGLRGAAWPGRQSGPALAWDRLQARMRWREIGADWRVDVPLLRIKQGAQTQALDGLAVAGGSRYALQTGEVDASPLLAALALSDRLQPGLRQWLYHARPQLRLSGLRVSGSRNGPLQLQGRVAELGFRPVGNAPGLSGLQGRFDGDGEGVELQLEPAATLRFDWPSGFGVVHELHLAGKVVGWREGDGWQIATPALRVQADDYAADVRGGLWFQGDGSRPRINLAASLDDSPVTVAKKFWVHSKMSKAATDWLDMALVGGTVSGGSGLVSGDLDDWPFVNNNGRFEASGHIHDGVIRFQRDWPQMQKVEADVAFIGNGFQMHGDSSLGGVAVDHFEAGIADFKTTELYVRANTRSEASAMLTMLRSSPLRQRYGDTLENLVAAGPAQVTFNMLKPLRAGGTGGYLRGSVQLQDAQLADPRWNLRFDNVSGMANYSDSGFDANGLAVMQRGHKGLLSLRAGNTVRDRRNGFEARLESFIDVKELFAYAPQMEWLRPYVHGVSKWRVGVDMPVAQPNTSSLPTQLSLDSDLLGTALDLPAPLDKAIGSGLPTHVQVALPVGSGDIDVAFDKLVAIKVRNRGERTGVRVQLGSDTVRDDPPANGLVVGGRTDMLDAMDWLGVTRSGAKSPASSQLPLLQIDVQAKRLLLIGGVFADTRLQLRPNRDALTVNLSGPSLTGMLDVPDADGAVVRGDLKTVHWQSATPPAPVEAPAGALSSALPEPARRAVAEFDPASIPPLSLDIGDLQFADIKLGAAVLRTRRLTDGMQVDQLQLQSGKQKIAVTGAWRGQGDAATTRLSARADSGDMGTLMQNLALGGQLRGGEGQIELNIGWQGAPTAFKMASLQGNLKAEMRNGQLLEVEPGAGRVLGLLSIAQLPRRLMLDFRDFFSKGLAFNRVDGELLFGDGIARADGIHMVGPAVDIDIRGQADLVQQTYDQRVDVHPKSGNLLTVVGAVAGGPVGAAVGAAANAVLSKPLGEIGAKTYHVTGSWKDPRVEVIERSAVNRDNDHN